MEMPISMGQIGNAYTIRRISGSGEVRSHLQAMGFNPGTKIRLIAQLHGDVIVGVRESRVAVNEEQARHILV